MMSGTAPKKFASESLTSLSSLTSTFFPENAFLKMSEFSSMLSSKFK